MNQQQTLAVTPRMQFLCLEPGSEIHLTPPGGTLFLANNQQHALNRIEAEFLAQCDGVHSVQDLIPSSWDDDSTETEFVLFVGHLLGNRIIKVVNDPTPTEVRITGSTSAYVPPHISLELTERCNLHCWHCYRDSSSRKHRGVAVETLLGMLRRLVDNGLRSIELTGGEPLLHPGFLQILQYCRDERRLRLVGLLTNGTLVTEQMADELATLGERLIVGVSLDGSTAETHDARRGLHGAFNRTVAGIRRLSARGLRVRVGMSVDGGNFADIENTLLLARELGAFAFGYNPAQPFGRAARHESSFSHISFEEALRIEQDLIDHYKGFLTTLTSDVICDLESGGNCGAGYRSYTIDPKGRLRPCPMWDTERLVIGNLLEQNVEAAFANELSAAMRDLPAPNKDICAGCPHTLYCRLCTLRGLQRSQTVAHCAWIQTPEVQALLTNAKIVMGRVNPT